MWYQGDKKIAVWITGDSERAQQPAGVERVIPMENGAGSKVEWTGEWKARLRVDTGGEGASEMENLK